MVHANLHGVLRLVMVTRQQTWKLQSIAIAPPKVAQADIGPIEQWLASNCPAYYPSQVELQAWARLNDSILGFLLLFTLGEDAANLELLGPEV